MKLSCGHDVADPSQVHYCSYLRLNELLALQPEADELRHHDEHLFIVTHQAFELWFKQILLELDTAIELIRRDEISYAIWLMRRIAAVLRLLTVQITLLETMSPPDFFAFRGFLAPASGTESNQFRAIEITSGLRDPRYRRLLEVPADPHPDTPKTQLWTDELSRRWDQPSLRDAFLEVLARRGLEAVDLFQSSGQPNPQSDLYQLAEALLDYDELFVNWRFVHARMAERALGMQIRGTGHTAGVGYLDHTVHWPRFFPELWSARSLLWERIAGTQEPEWQKR